MIHTDAPLNFWDQSATAHVADLERLQSIRGLSDLSRANDPAYRQGAEGQAAQAAALGMYGDLARGGSSLAQDQLRQSATQNVSAGYGLAAMQRGGSLYGARRQAGTNAAATNAAADQQAAILRAQQMEAGRAGLADLGSLVYGQGLGYQQLAQQAALQGQQNSVNWYQTQRELDLKRKQSDRQFYGDLINGGIGLGSSLLGMAGAA